MIIYYNQLELSEGFEVLSKDKEDRLVRGRRVSACSGHLLFNSLRGTTIKCWDCGCEASMWIVERGKNDQEGKPPVMNLYGVKDDKLVLFTRDHIIPKSLGGIDDVANLRPACSICNGTRGNHSLDPADIQFRLDNPHLISEHRLKEGIKAVTRAYWREGITKKERTALLAPFLALDPGFKVGANPYTEAKSKH